MPGSSNFTQFNPNAINQDTDGAYAAEAQVQGGILHGQAIPSTMLNKLFYSLSTFVAAFGQMMANKGYNVSDASLNTLAGVLAQLQTGADQTPAFVALGYTPNLTINLASAQSFQVTVGGTMTVAFQGAVPGMVRRIGILQDNAGGHAVTWPIGSGANQILGAVGVDFGANTMTLQEFWVDGAGALRAVAGATVTP